MDVFLALLTSLPTGNSTIRMRMWRALKSTGCGVLRDGVYVLPAAAPQTAAFGDVEAEVRAANGFAMTAELKLRAAEQLEPVRALFDRSSDYGALVVQIDAAKGALRRLGKRKADTLLQRLRRACEQIEAIDFYPGEARLQARAAMSALEHAARALFGKGEPRAGKGRVRRVEAAKYLARTWATRKDPWVDRLASAWLIKRFIDRKARFAWIDGPGDRPKGAVGFDYDGAEFTHVGNRVTFEALLASFGLETDAALVRIAAVVHFLDVGGIPVADAKGLETVLRGAREGARNDDERVLAAARVFDLVYSAYQGAETRL